MDPSNIFAEVRSHITKAQTEQALKKLLAFLEQASGPMHEWADTVRQIKAKFYRTEKDQTKGVISFDNAQLSYSQVNNELLNTVEAIEKGLPVPRVIQKPNKKIPWMAIASVITLLLATATFFMLRNGGEKPIEQPIINSDLVNEQGTGSLDACPAFPVGSMFNIMLLPFKPLGSDKTDVDSGLRDRLARELEKYSIPAYVLTRSIDVDDPNVYPSSYAEAERLGKPCNAKLIIWGTSEKLTGGKIITTTKFRFLDIEEFSQTEFFLDSNAEVDTISSLSSIAAEGSLTQTLEQSLKILFGLVAHQSGDHAVAVNIIEEVADDMDEPLGANWGMLLADSYTNLSNPEQAIQVYNNILEQNPEHQGAREKRGYLLYQTGNYRKAAEDLTVIAEKEPENTRVRTARAAAYVRSNQLGVAKTEIEAVEQLDEGHSVPTNKLRIEYDERYRTEVRRKGAAEEQLKTNPKDTSAMRIQAEAAQNLGEYEVAGLAASTILSIDPKSTFAITALQEIKPKIRDTIAFNNMIRRQVNPSVLQQVKGIRNFQIRQ